MACMAGNLQRLTPAGLPPSTSLVEALQFDRSDHTYHVSMARTCLRSALAGLSVSCVPLLPLLLCLSNPPTVSFAAAQPSLPAPALSGRLPDSVFVAVSPSCCHFAYAAVSEGGSAHVWVCKHAQQTTRGSPTCPATAKEMVLSWLMWQAYMLVNCRAT